MKVICHPYTLGRTLDATPAVYRRITTLHMNMDALHMDMPSQVASMAALRSVKLRGTVTGGLHHLSSLCHLHTLDMSYCTFPKDELPADLARLTQLVTLTLCYSKIRRGWEHLLPLQRLESLSLTDSAPEPEQLGSLVQLKSLSMAKVRPPWKGMPTQLRSLTLENCKMRVSERLSLMTELRRLSIFGAIITNDGWHHIPGQLQHLRIDSCELDLIPDRISALGQLTYLSLFSNKIKGGWQHLTPLRRLLELQLDLCGLQHVPACISAMGQLTTLSLGCNNIKGGWQHLTPLRRLLALDLVGCQLTHVPSELAALTRLIYVDLSDNPIEGGLQHLSEQLLRLDMMHCDLQQLPAGLSRFTRLTLLDLQINPELGTLARVHTCNPVGTLNV